MAGTGGGGGGGGGGYKGISNRHTHTPVSHSGPVSSQSMSESRENATTSWPLSF